MSPKKSDVEREQKIHQKIIHRFWQAFETFIGGYGLEKTMQCIQQLDGKRIYEHSEKMINVGKITISEPFGQRPAEIPEILNLEIMEDLQETMLAKSEWELLKFYYQHPIPVTVCIMMHGSDGAIKENLNFASLKDLNKYYSSMMRL